MATTDSNENIHMGRNVKRFREMLGIKQDALALDLNVSQQTVSQIEQKETIDKGLLEQISKILKVPIEAIKNFDEEKAIYNIQNNYEGSNATATNINTNNNNCIINYADKWIESIEEIKNLYERLLDSEKQKIELLGTIIKKDK